MRIHHLNCGTMCPASFATGGEALVCHVLLIEHDEGLILCDTGFGTGDLAQPSRLGPVRHLLQPVFDERETAIAQVRALGFSPKDVRHILLTHLDLDHAGGLGDFPSAAVHLLAEEHRAATAPSTRAEKGRYFPIQWAHGPDWRVHAPDGERWEGFERVRPIEGLGETIALIPLYGHTRGHAGIAVQGDEGWLLYAGDAYFHRAQVRPDGTHARGPRGLDLFQRIGAILPKARVHNLKKLQSLAVRRAHDLRVFPAHDGTTLAQLRGDLP